MTNGLRKAKNILFTSVVGPHGVDSAHSRFKNPMSLMSNQVTRGQKYYTVQMCSRSFAFDLFGANLNANIAILDFPLAGHLEAALKSGSWDRVGISAIMANFEKLVLTYKIVRSVNATVPIDIGGHIANETEVLEELMGRLLEINPNETFQVVTDTKATTGFSGVTFVMQDGLKYYSQLKDVGLKNDNFVYAPLVETSFDKRVLGIPVSSTAAGLVLADVGCPMKCNFCCTSQKFGGRFVPFLNTAQDIMTVANAHADRGRNEMFVMSENFSLNTDRMLEVLKLMEEQKRPHKWSVFSSAQTLIRLGIENLVKLGYCFVWIGLEEASGQTYNKMHGINLAQLINDLQSHGIEVLGSTILGFENQKVEDIDREVEHAISLGCAYNQFMLYMPMPGTPLWREVKQRGLLKKNFPWPDIHGQTVQNWHHPHLTDQQMESKLDEAFILDFERLGPSLFRMARTHFSGYKKTKDWDHELVQMRRKKMMDLFKTYVPILSVMHRDLKNIGHRLANEVQELKESITAELGFSERFYRYLATPILHFGLKLEKYRYNRSQRLRKMEEPSVHLTHYGDFNHNYPSILPKVKKGANAVAIPKLRMLAEEINRRLPACETAPSI